MRNKATHCYVGFKTCGCAVAAVVDDSPDVSKDVAKFIRHGLTIERKTIEETRGLLHSCIHAVKKTVQKRLP